MAETLSIKSPWSDLARRGMVIVDGQLVQLKYVDTGDVTPDGVPIYIQDIGITLDPSGDLGVIPGSMAGYKWYKDDDFQSGESPRVLDIQTDLGRPANAGSIVNAGNNPLDVEISQDGTVYGDVMEIDAGSDLSLDHFDAKKIRLTWNTGNTKYRVVAQ